MKEAIIVTRSKSYYPGSLMPPVDFKVSELFNPFKKNWANKVRKQLQEAVEEEQLDFEVNDDYTWGNLEELKLDGVAFVILTPLVSQYVELEFLGEDEYIILTEKEYEEMDTTRIVQKMKSV